MNIRFYNDADYEQVKIILQSGGNFDDVWDSRAHWKAKIKKNPTSILIAENEKEIVGCILIIKDDWTCFLFRLAIKENYQNKGVGSLLIAKAEESLKKDGVEEVAIFVNEDDPKLQQYYEKRGYLRGGKYRCLYKKLK